VRVRSFAPNGEESTLIIGTTLYALRTDEEPAEHPEVMVKVPNAQTRAAMAAIDEMVKTRQARFSSANELFAELEEASGQ
jgi:hypothetical protein